jgi:hypothetical protein
MSKDATLLGCVESFSSPDLYRADVGSPTDEQKLEAMRMPILPLESR